MDGDDPMAHGVVMGDGVAVAMEELPAEDGLMRTAKHRAPGVRVRSHHWKVRGHHVGSPMAQITPERRLVLFHYVTRSRDDFVGRKMKLYESEKKRIGHGFVTSIVIDDAAGTDEWFQQKVATMNLDAPVCSGALHARYAELAHAEAQRVRSSTI